MKVLLDTNVLIDYFAQRAGFADAANSLRVAQCFGDLELWATTQSLMDASYILRGAVPASQLQDMLAQSLSFLQVSSIDKRDVLVAFSSGWEDAEDRLITRCAEKIGADYIITRNLKDFERASVTCMDPASFLEMLEERNHCSYALESL